ncbi:MAG: hypothetical protein M1828_000656 [Chrysothrix sp. TS-e1954]|nr:MAG: hypothetical protein M1828_000656 [Chrysothrix sp. TS-e1954]
MAKSKSLPAATRSRSEVSPSVKVTGPRGELLLPIPKFLRIDQDDKTRRATVSVEDRTVKAQRAMWGTTRAHLNNFIVGVSEGHTTILRLVGVGYRALIENAAVTKSPAYPGQQFVSLKVGFNHPIELGVPQGVKASVPLPTRILLEGINKEVIKSFAAKIRAWRVPEPYKGKGIFVDDETVILKAKRIK